MIRPRRRWDSLSPIDKEIRRIVGPGMWNDGQTLLTIRMFGGFEIFGFYESWSEGYEITAPKYPEIKSKGYALDDAVRNFRDDLKNIKK